MKRIESRDEYALNSYIESLFVQIDKDLDIEIYEYHNFQNILACYSGAELERLQIMMYEIIRIYTYKWLSILAFDFDVFDVASMYDDYAVVLYSGGAVQLSYESSNYFKERLSINKIRHLVENAFTKLKSYSAIATRFDKLKQSYENIVASACAYFYLKL